MIYVLKLNHQKTNWRKEEKRLGGTKPKLSEYRDDKIWFYHEKNENQLAKLLKGKGMGYLS